MATASFKDQREKTWTLILNGPLLRDIKEQLGVNLVALEADPFNVLSSDPVKLVDCLFMVCEEQAKASGITSREFGISLPPDLDGPIEALREAVINFFPSGKRSVVRSALEASEKASNKAMEILVQKVSSDKTLERVTNGMVAMGEKALEEMLTSQDFTSTSPTEPKN